MSSSSPSVKPDVTLSLTLPSSTPQSFRPEERGIKLIQLLLTCANHASSGNLHRADSCLRRISQLASITGDSMQRLAARFASALAVRIVKRWPGLYNALHHSGSTSPKLDRARTIFSQSFPYMGINYLVLTKTLVQCMSWDRVIHIVYFGSGDLPFWGPLLQKFAQGPMGPPQVKITCVSPDKVLLEELGITLLKESKSMDIPFQYNPLNVSLIELTQDMIEVRPGEALAFVSILNLHVLLAEDDRVDAHFGVNQNNNGIKENQRMAEFLAMLRSMSPKILLLVEQESDHNLTRLVDRFVEGLHYYSAVFDSIDSTFGDSSGEDRIAVEEMFGKEIENIVACEGLERDERHERCRRWFGRLSQAGFKALNLWLDALEEATKVLEGYRPVGYKVVGQRPGLLICWHDRPIYAVSAWTI